MRFPDRPLRYRTMISLISAALLVGLTPALTMAQSTPQITGYSVNSGQTSLTINGSNFGTESSSASVQIDGDAVAITSWSNSSITVPLPSNANPGVLTVTVAPGETVNFTFGGVERGYYTLSSNGDVTPHGSVQTFGDLSTIDQSSSSPAIQIIPTSNYEGYWILTKNGTTYAFGDATNLGSVNQNITAVSMAVLPSGEGAYVLSNSGVVYPLGQAANYGNAPSNTRAIAIASSANGAGYWILSSSGTVFAFGDAPSMGSPPAPAVTNSNAPTYPNGMIVRVGNTWKTEPYVPVPTTSNAVALVPTTDGQGYWILFQNGTVATEGDAVSHGELSASQLGTNTASGFAVTPDQDGYSILTTNGDIYSFGDALSASTASGAVGLAMTAITGNSTTPPPTTTTGSFLSMAYGSFLNPSGGSYNALVNDSAGISVINPTWFYVTQNPNTLAWDINSPPSGSQDVVSEAHSEGVQVWPMIGSPDIGPFQTDAHVASLVSQIVSLAENNNYDGITIDFEPDSLGGMSLSEASQQYTYFVSQLGPALESIGKKLMVDVYASSYPNTIFNYTAIAQYATYLNIMDYPEYNATTQAGPTSGLPWDLSVIQNAVSEGLSPSQIILGVAPYGHYWTFNNNGITGDGDIYDTQAASLLSSNSSIVPVWDSAFQSEVFMTDEYLNSNDQWTVNPNGQAVAPTSVLSTADEPQSLSQVKNLQGLLNYILLRYAVQNNQTVPGYLTQDGHYGPLTADAVTQFQQDFNVTGATTGVYDAATQTALKGVINNWGIGEYQYWVDTTASIQNRVQDVAEAYHLAGIAPWRLPFETSDYWQAIESTVNVSHTDE